MRSSSFINFAVLIIIGAAAYFLTLYMDTRKPLIIKQSKPEIIIQPDAPIENFKTRQRTPEFSFKNIDGKTYSSSDFKNKIIILNFWASWCPPCLKEFPHFLTAAKEFENEIVFIGVSSDLNEEAINKYLSTLGDDVKNPNIFITFDKDQNITKNIFQVYGLPETILIDEKQIMRTKIIGADWDYNELKSNIKALKRQP